MKKKSLSVLLSLCLSLVFLVVLAVPAFAAEGFAGGKGTVGNPWHIRTVSQLQEVKNHLDGHFVLDKDLDLSSVRNWTPIGSYENEFTGTFDGNDHQITNLTIKAPQLLGGGLFGFIADGSVTNLRLKNISVSGVMFAGGLAGMAEDSTVENIRLTGNNTLSGIMYVGGVLGAAENMTVKNISAKAKLKLYGVAVISQAAGIVCGGAEGADFVNCKATGGSIRFYGDELTQSSGAVGGLAGCATDGKVVRNCSASGIKIVVSQCSMVGGLLGHSGSTAGTADKSKRTKISGCTVKNVTIKADDDSDRIGMLLGSGYYRPFFNSEIAEPTAYYVMNCTVSGKIEVTPAKVSGLYADREPLIGAVAGFAGRNSAVASTNANVTLNGDRLSTMIGGTLSTTSMDQLW